MTSRRRECSQAPSGSPPSAPRSSVCVGGLFISAVAAWAELLDLCHAGRRVLYVGGLLLPLRGRLDTLDEGEAQAILESGKVPRIEDKSTFVFFLNVGICGVGL